MIQDSLSRLLLVLSFLLVLPFAGAHAQTEQSVPVRAVAATQTSEQQSLPPEPDADVTILRDEYAGKYSPSTLESLAKLYWRLGAFDMEDDEAIGNYIKIVECSLYAEYYTDDLEWREIVNAMRDHIAKTRDTFPVSIQFVLPVHLGKYDTTLGGFPLINKTGFKEAKRVQIDSVDRDREICHSRAAINDYPLSVMLIVQQPFTLDFVNIDEHVAQAYILRKKSEYSALPEHVRLQKYERDAYLRLRISFSQYHGSIRGEQGRLLSILHGRIDGYDLFEDSAQKRLMLSVDTSTAKAQPAPEMSVSPAVTAVTPVAPTPAGEAAIQTPPVAETPTQAPAATP